ncbi:MAG: hypothetical protein ACI3YK_07620 [Eubacteriales bacterium]
MQNFFPEIKNDSRPVTDETLEQAYAWLSENIDLYSAHGCKRGTRLLKCIRTNPVMPEDYGDFLELFHNDPFSNTLTESVERGGDFITSANLDCYFVRYNGVPLPIGFIISQFKEDFQTPEDIRRFREEVFDTADPEKKSLKWLALDRWHQNLNQRKKDIGELCDSDPFAFRSAAAPLFTLLCRLIPTVVLTLLFILFCHQIRLVPVLWQWMFQNHFRASGTLLLSGGISAFGATLSDSFAFTEYLSAFPLHLILNSILFLILLYRYLQLIHGLIFLHGWIGLRHGFSKQKRTVRHLNAGILKEYVNRVGIAEDGSLTLEFPISLRSLVKEASAASDPEGFRNRADQLHRRSVYLRTYLKDENGTQQTGADGKPTVSRPRNRLLLACILIVIFSLLNLPLFYKPILAFFS